MDKFDVPTNFASEIELTDADLAAISGGLGLVGTIPAQAWSQQLSQTLGNLGSFFNQPSQPSQPTNPATGMNSDNTGLNNSLGL